MAFPIIIQLHNLTLLCEVPMADCKPKIYH